MGLTYSNNTHTDGSGAQLQRIYGIYAISRLMKLPYIHSPLTQIDYQGLKALEENSTNQDIVHEYNKIFNIPSDIGLPRNHIVYELEKATVYSLEQLKKEAAKRKTFILARIFLPYAINDCYPESYQVVKDITPFPFQQTPVIRIAIHVRRGELFVVDSDRMLPNSYYISVAQRIRKFLDALNLKYVFELHTEIPSKAFTVMPDHHGICNRIADSVTVDSKSNKLEEFDSIPNLEKYINCDPIDTLRKMATANVLIMSHSSFSYLSAILNVKGAIIYHKFWHSPADDWLIANDAGDFSMKQFLEKVNGSFAIHQNPPVGRDIAV